MQEVINSLGTVFDSRSPEYAWVDLSATGGGRDINITSIKYAEKMDKEYYYAKGNKPKSIQSKNISYEGEIGLPQSEFEALIRSSKNNSILYAILDTLTVSYAPESGIITTDQLLHIQFTESSKELSQGDGFMEIKLPIMFLGLKHNI